MNKTRKYFDAEIETMDRDKLEALQLRRLKAQLKRCYRDSEFYRQKFQEAGVKPDDVRSISDIIIVLLLQRQNFVTNNSLFLLSAGIR